MLSRQSYRDAGTGNYCGHGAECPDNRCVLRTLWHWVRGVLCVFFWDRGVLDSSVLRPKCPVTPQSVVPWVLIKLHQNVCVKRLMTGEWSGCVRAKCGSGGLDSRHVYCKRIADNVVVDDRSCDASSRPPSSRSCFRYCEHHRYTYAWMVGPWSECHTTGPCQQGLRPGGSNSCPCSCT